MLFNKKVSEVRFITKDEKGRVELWQHKPTFVDVGCGETFFVDLEEMGNQLSLDAPINKKITDMFLLKENTCLEIRIFITTKNMYMLPGRSYSYSSTLAKVNC